jgi:hypothetical protein
MSNDEYRRWYNKGWRYSNSASPSLEHLDATGAPDAAYDGYEDAAAGRRKWEGPEGMRPQRPQRGNKEATQ